MPESTIPSEISALKLPDIHGVIVIGGAYMELLGIRPAQDIDMVVSYKNWLYLRDELKFPVRTKRSMEYMQDESERFEIWQVWYDRLHQRAIRFDELISNSVAHEEGFRVPSIDYQIQLKQWEGRPKDLQDIVSLEKISF